MTPEIDDEEPTMPSIQWPIEWVDAEELCDMYPEPCRAGTHGPRNSTCTCERD